MPQHPPLTDRQLLEKYRHFNCPDCGMTFELHKEFCEKSQPKTKERKDFILKSLT